MAPPRGRKGDSPRRAPARRPTAGQAPLLSPRPFLPKTLLPPPQCERLASAEEEEEEEEAPPPTLPASVLARSPRRVSPGLLARILLGAAWRARPLPRPFGTPRPR